MALSKPTIGGAIVFAIGVVWVAAAIATKPSFPSCHGGVNPAVGARLHEDEGFSVTAVSFPVGDHVWLMGFPTELVSTYPDTEVWVTDTDPVSGRGAGHFLPANVEAVREMHFAGLALLRSDATPQLLAAFPDQDAVDYAKECVEERAQLSLS